MFSTDDLWIVIVGFIIAFVLAFGIGANDVANSFGTSVGSKVLTLRQACILATIFEIAGAVLIGYKVSDTLRKGIIEVELYEGHEEELMLGFLSTLVSGAFWLIVASWFKLPVSGTHTVVGATLGFSLVARGLEGVTWSAMITIVVSWFASPVTSGLISCAIYWIVRWCILFRDNPLKAGLISLPFFYGITIFINVISVILDGPELLYLNDIEKWLSVVISIAVGVIVGLGVYFFLVPRQKRDIIQKFNESKNNGTQVPSAPISTQVNNFTIIPNGKSDLTTIEKPVEPAISTTSSQVELVNYSADETEERPKDVSPLFSYLQILTAIFASFAHGGNDVSNAIGPLIGLYLLYEEGVAVSKSETPIWILVYGGVGIAVGLWIWGRRVIKTIGNDLTEITPISGFTIEIGAATTVLLASNLSLPISTTHCKVGSIVFVGYSNTLSFFTPPKERLRLAEEGKNDLEEKEPKKAVDWKLFLNIFAAWIITLPIAAGVSALVMYILSVALL